MIQKKKFFTLVSSLSLLTLIVFGINKVLAWTEPSVAPTGGNVTAPLRLDGSGRIDVSAGTGAGGYISSGNYGGTGSAAFFPSGLYTGGPNWIYNNTYFSGLLTDNLTSTKFSINAATGDASFAGNVGVGTMSPGTSLQVGNTSTSGQRQIFIADNSYGLRLYGGFQQSAVIKATGTTGYLDFQSGNNNDQKYVFSGTGNVGIGTTSPNASAKLDVNGRIWTVGAGGSARNIYYDLAGNTIGAGSSIYSYGPICTGNTAGACTGLNGVVIGPVNTSALVNITNSGVTFFNAGNVGIGGTSPTYKLSVAGDINTTGCYRVNGVCISAGGGTIGGSGTAGSIPRFTPDGTTLGNSTLTSDGLSSTANGNFFVTGNVALVGNYIYQGGGTGNVNATGGPFTYADTNNTVMKIGSGNGALLVQNYSGTTVNALSVNGNSYFNGGNVGIGTIGPTSLLDVNGNALFGGISAGSVGNVQITTGGASPISNRLTYGTDGSGWKFAIGKNQGGAVTEQLTIQDNGNVGIGTTSPGYKLDVAGNINAYTYYGNGKEAFTTGDSYLRINQGTAFTSGIWMGGSNLMGGGGYLAMGSNGGTTNSRVYIYGGSYNGANVINLDGSNGTVTATRFVGDGSGLTGIGGATQWTTSAPNIYYNTGNVGIGTGSPGQKLQVNGNVLIVDGATNSLYLGQNTGATAYNAISLNGNTTDSGNMGMTGGGNTDTTLYVNSPGNIYLRTNSFSNNGTIILGGNVGIGTATPQYRLDLNQGTIGWGASNTRTESRDNAGLRGDAGAQSGFFQTATPQNYPAGATSWWHLLDVRHSNPNNNYAMQIAGSFFDQNLYFRKTSDSPTAGWSKFVAQDSSGNIALPSGIWNSSGNVGIGTPSPGSKLQIAGGGVQDLIIGNAGNSQQLLVGTGSGYSRLQSILQGTGYNNLVLNDAGGNVGIGTTTPGTTLDVFGPLSLSGNVKEIEFRDSPGGATRQYVWMDSNNYILGLGAGSVSNSMFIDTSGNVGIGTANPQTKFNLAGGGDGTVKGQLGNNLRLTTSTTTVGAGSDISFAGPKGPYAANGTDIYAAISAPIDDPSSGYNNFGSAGYLSFGVKHDMTATSLTEMMRIDYAGVHFFNSAFTNSFSASSTTPFYAYVNSGINTTDGGDSNLNPNSVYTKAIGIYGVSNGTGSNGTVRHYGVLGSAGQARNSYGVYGLATDSTSYGVYCDTGLGHTGLCGGGTAWTPSSDRRLKKNITTIENGLDRVMQLRGVDYSWKDDPTDKKNAGFIAQEVLPILPEVVVTGKDGYYALDYGGVTALTVEAIKELKIQNDVKFQKLQTENDELRARVEALESKLK